MSFTARLERHHSHEVHTLLVEGRIDAATAAGFEEHLNDATQKSGGALVLDLGGVDYISSSGLRAVLVAAKHAHRDHGRFVVTGLKSHVRDVFMVSGFLDILHIAETTEDAARHIKG